MKTHLEECRKMSDVDLLDDIREDPRFPLWPAVRALLDRVEVKPESPKAAN